MSALASPLKTLAALQAASACPAEPFRILLPDGSDVYCSDTLRFLPGKRIVMRAIYKEKIVLAKLFFDARNLQKEMDGFSLLQRTGCNTPRQLAAVRLDHGGICFYEFIDNAEPLDNLWRKSSTQDKTALLDKIFKLLQQCYQQGVLQQDLHLGNFMMHNHTLLMLDPASCTPSESTSQKSHNLALLLAQLPFADWQAALEKIDSAFPALSDSKLAANAKRCWQKRHRDYLAKIFRECTDVADLSNNGLHILCRRKALTNELSQRLRNPDTLISNATILKNGNSAKVFFVNIDGRKLVIKQYINKDWLRKIRRAFRPSRAARSWHFAHAFAFADILVPEPVALIEQKRGPLVTSAWYISEYTEGKDLLTSWQEREPSVDELSAIHSLFLTLQLIQTSHGDMKASNLITDGNSIALIDYDGAREHSRSAALSHALQNDRQRFLQNWRNNSVLTNKLLELLGA